jgi:hypothetical protein
MVCLGKEEKKERGFSKQEKALLSHSHDYESTVMMHHAPA